MNIKINNHSLMTRTVITLVLFSISILVFMYLFQITFLNIYYEKYKVQEVNDFAESAIKSKNLNSFLETNSVKSDICALVIADDEYYYNEYMKGCILLKPDSNTKKLMNKMYNSDEKNMIYKITNPYFKTKTFLYGLRISNSEYIFLNSQLEILDSTSIILKQQLIYLLVIAIFFAVIIAFFISNSITKPIRDITDKARKMAKGNLDLNFSNSNISEINKLEEVLNYAKEEMQKTDDYRKDLMANVGHDLKTPLTLIKSYAEMIRDISFKDKEKRNKHLNIIINETDRLNNLVNDILTISKLESNKNALELETYDIISEIKIIISKFEILELTEDYKFILDMPKSAYVIADKNRINQVIYNLITNAINYTGEDQKIFINVSQAKNKLKVEIKDTGKGIDKDKIDHIWEKYYKNDKKHKRNKVGTGLGLSIVRNILEEHKFEYGVKSKENKGTTFYFYLKTCKENKKKSTKDFKKK